MLLKVEKADFGKIQISGTIYSGDTDFFLFLDSVEKCEKSHMKTVHDFEKMMLKDPEVVIFGTGFNSVVKIDENVEKAAKKENVELHVLSTPDALKKFSELSKKGKRVAALIHTTC